MNLQAITNNMLLNGYQQHRNSQNVAYPYQNAPVLVTRGNQLLNSIPVQADYNSIQMQQLRQTHQLKQFEMLNNLENIFDKDKIRESVIRPESRDSKIEKNELVQKWKTQEEMYFDKDKKDYGPEIKKCWERRTNEPYKNILKKENYSREFKTRDDLVVHRITNKDKEGVNDEFKKLDENREKHNKELKVIYSTDHENEHKKKFEYNHVYKYRVQYNPNDHEKLKKDKIKYYKERQRKEEEGKKQMDDIAKLLMDDGIFNQDELNSVNLIQVAENKNMHFINSPNDASVTNITNIANVNNGNDRKQKYLDRKNNARAK